MCPPKPHAIMRHGSKRALHAAIFYKRTFVAQWVGRGLLCWRIAPYNVRHASFLTGSGAVGCGKLWCVPDPLTL
ncbi:hypothetical protein BJI49_09895 [Acetobacter pasteurianus]|nr:hypothetical protein BJI49_09895 [Acetobacter pasteurianus]